MEMDQVHGWEEPRAIEVQTATDAAEGLHVSPYEVPSAITITLSPDKRRAELRFRYIQAEEPRGRRLKEDDEVVVHLGKHSGRLLGIGFPPAGSTEPAHLVEQARVRLVGLLNRRGHPATAGQLRPFSNLQVVSVVLGSTAPTMVEGMSEGLRGALR